jgi:transposase|tara:strand:+ start:110 stop:1768 length:1659 start_codon:yes stop_codon:yes gene_type:complete
MTSPDPELPDNIESCHVLIEQLRAESAHLETVLAKYQETIADQEQTIENLAADNALLKRSLFGSRRERYVDDSAQTLLFDPATLDSPKPDEENQQPPEEKKRTSKGRRPRVFPDFLPREEQRLHLNPEDIPEEMRDNPDIRRFFKKVGETLELIPMQLKVVEQFQEVIALDRPDETTAMVAARRPVRLIQSFAGPSLWAYLTVSRFADHLPYYRLEDILGRSGFRIDRSTQWRWMRGLGRGVTPLVDLMWERARQSAVLGMDETPVMELGGPGRTLKGYLWAGVGDANHPYDCFFYTSDRRSIRAETMLEGFQGYLTADAYIAYERIGRLWPGVFKTSCWVHGRRKFEACHHLGKTKQTHNALAYFRRLFDIEDRYRQSSDDVRLAARCEQSRPLVTGFHEWLEAERVRQLPKSKLTGAINYMLTRWESFTRFLESGAVPMDNNAAERALKFPILGRKAWLFFGNQTAGETAAKLFTLTKTCNRHRIDPFAYLQDVYARLPTTSASELPSLLPDRWIAEHPQHLIQERVQESLDRAQRAREQRAERRLRRSA